jgi:7-cyano-7-deazaguanine synthase
MAKELAIILNNGGVNAAVATAVALQRYRAVMVHVTMDLPSAAGFERAFQQQVAMYKPFRAHTVAMPFLGSLSPVDRSNALSADPRHGVAAGPRLVELLPLIAVAARFAVHYNAEAIYGGLRVGEQSGELSRATEFGQIWNEMLQHPCGQGALEVLMPVLELEPWQVVDLGYQVDAPFEHTWSCLEDPAEACGMCRGCRSRDAAFQQAAKPDPAAPAKAVESAV